MKDYTVERTTARHILGADRNPSLLALIDYNSQFSSTYPALYEKLVGVDVTLISEFTLHGLKEPLRYFCRILGVEPTVTVAPPYQIEKNLLSESIISGARTPRICLIMSDLEKMCPQHSVAPSAAQREAFDSTIERRIRLCQEFAERTQTKVIVSSLFSLYPGLTQGFSTSDVFARHSFIDHANRILQELCERAGVEVLPVHHTLLSFGALNCLSLKDYLASDNPFSPEGSNRVAEILARQLSALFTKRKKLLVLDLDNTLWKGVLGEDGATGIKFRPDSFEGRIFWQVLSHIKALASTGTILAINSKNNEHEVFGLLDSSEFPLKREDFACIKANWKEKSDNLLAISEELGLSLDSMVMLDDSDAECIRIRQAHPEVTVVQVPKKLSEYPSVLSGLPFFERPRITEADVIRKLDYQNSYKRKQLAQSTNNFETFLNALQIELTLFRVDQKSFERVEQLFERTNQFNMSGKRYTRQELEGISKDGGLILAASYQDSFGSAGIISALVIRKDGDMGVIENFVVSCRVLGRSVEKHILSNINRGFFHDGLSSLKLIFQETDRNAPAKAFFNELKSHSAGVVLTQDLESSPHVSVIVREPGV